MDSRIRALAEAEAASRLRSHPEATLGIRAILALTEAPQLACGHLDGFLPPDHPDPEACIAARQARVDALWATLQRHASGRA